MGLISDMFNFLIWTIINLIYCFIDAIYSSFVKLNSINIINDLLTKDNILINAYNSIIVISIVVLSVFAVWNYVKVFLDPDDTQPIQTITFEIVKCTFLVVLSSFFLTQIFNFSIVFSSVMGNLFLRDNHSFSGSIVESYIEINDSFVEKYDGKGQEAELEKFSKEKEENINGYIKEIEDLNKQLNKYSDSTGIKYLFDKNNYSCATKKITNKEEKEHKPILKDETNGMLTPDDKNADKNKQLGLTAKIESRKEYCNNIKKEIARELPGKSTKFPNTPDTDPFTANGINVNDSTSVHNFISNQLKGESYEQTRWYKNEIWNWHYVVKEGAFGISALDTIEICWGGNTPLLILVGFFLVYAMFFSGIMLARRQLEMLLMFFFSPLIFACSICNKQRRQSLYEQLSSLVLQAGAIMMILGIGAILISKVANLNFGDGLEGLLIKTFFVCGIATLILTGSQSVNKFIGANVSSNAGREAMQAMSGFNSALKGTAAAGAIATAGAGVAGLAGAKIARHPVATAKGIGSFAKNGVSGIVNSARANSNIVKSLGSKTVGKGLKSLGGISPTVGTYGSILAKGGQAYYKEQADKFREKAQTNKSNMIDTIQSAKKNLSSPAVSSMMRNVNRHRYRGRFL